MYSGWPLLLPNIAYHTRHGFDQVVLYVDSPNLNSAFEMLAKPIEQGLVTIIAVDEKPSGYNRIVDSYDELINTQYWINNDCTNRFKGHAELLVLGDFDEFLYNPVWRNDNQLEGRSLLDEMKSFRQSSADFLPTTYYDWERLAPVSTSALHSTMRRSTKENRFGKAVIKPDQVAQAFQHAPLNCFGKVCEDDWDNCLKLEHAHFRLYRDNDTGVIFDRTGKEEVEIVDDKLFMAEASVVDDIVSNWLGHTLMSLENFI